MLSGDKSKIKPTETRLYYLDWIRVLAMLSVFFYHCDRFFDFRDYPIQNLTRSLISTIHREFFQIWIMPLFFVISGAAVVYSLRPRGAGVFVKKRTFRILVPFIFIGLFVTSPPQIYLERLMNGQFSGTFFQWLPHYFNGLYLLTPEGNFPLFGMHLWYLETLFTQSLILLPLFIPYGADKTSVLARLSIWFRHPVSLLSLAAPLAIISVLTELLGFAPLRMAGGWDQFSYMLFYALGYMVFCDHRIQDTMKQYAMVFLLLSVSLTGLYLITGFGINAPDVSIIARHNLIQGDSAIQVPVAWLGMLAVRSVIAWCWCLSLLGLGARFLNHETRLIKYANEAVLPFYILHQTILLIIGYFVIQLSANILVKYGLITTISFVVIMIVYELLVRRVNASRFLFGMKLKS